jgi:5-methylcytosine-specific restriction endonuclease McrA
MPYADSELKRARAHEYYKRNRAEVLAKKRTRTAEQNEEVNAVARRYREKTGDRRRGLDRARYAKDPEGARARRRASYWASPQRHREVARKAHAAVMARDPESIRARVRKRWAQEKGAEGTCSAAEWKEMLSFYGNKCLRCGADGSECTLTQDHIIPVSVGGSHWPENLQPLCQPCNSSKGARNSFDYRPDEGARFARWAKAA